MTVAPTAPRVLLLEPLLPSLDSEFERALEDLEDLGPVDRDCETCRIDGSRFHDRDLGPRAVLRSSQAWPLDMPRQEELAPTTEGSPSASSPSLRQDRRAEVCRVLQTNIMGTWLYHSCALTGDGRTRSPCAASGIAPRLVRRIWGSSSLAIIYLIFSIPGPISGSFSRMIS